VKNKENKRNSKIEQAEAYGNRYQHLGQCLSVTLTYLLHSGTLVVDK